MKTEDLASRLLQQKTCLAVVGLGYVGLPLALEFAKKGVKVIGFDVDTKKISQLKNGVDETLETTPDDFQKADPHISYVSSPEELKRAALIIVTVPTPIDVNRNPLLTPLTKACETIGRNFSKGTIVVFESTVYPGLTEEHCLPLLEKHSGYSFKEGDFFLGYSPERINPGNREHSLTKIVKVVSGQNKEICDTVAQVYEIIVQAGVHKAESIKVAEAAKVIENTQRDLNIALMNELSIIFGKMGISTEAVLNAAATKWNFIKFHPGLVGGHCIGVDPYYLTSKAEQLGYHPQVVLAGRRINDSMGAYVAQQTIKQMIKAKKAVEGARVLVLGLTFKENVPDIRNTKVFDIINELESYGVYVLGYDPFVTSQDAEFPDNLELLSDLDGIKDIDVIVIATPHDVFKVVSLERWMENCRKDNGTPVLIDVRWMCSEPEAQRIGFKYWRL